MWLLRLAGCRFQSSAWPMPWSPLNPNTHNLFLEKVAVDPICPPPASLSENSVISEVADTPWLGHFNKNISYSADNQAMEFDSL